MGKAKEHAKRVVILIAVAFFALSSLALTVTYFVQNKDASSGNTAQQQALDQIKKQQEAQAMNEPLTGFEATPFDKAGVTELKVETLKEGDGTAATAASTVNANYFGWTSDGKIFDSSQKNGTATPISFPLSGVISGWTEGLTGVKAGSTVKLTIPADKAYGVTGSPPAIGANEPLVFIVELKEVK